MRHCGHCSGWWVFGYHWLCVHVVGARGFGTVYAVVIMLAGLDWLECSTGASVSVYFQGLVVV